MLQEGIDYYINEDGNFVFTAAYHLKRGYCCKNKCLHCPWDYGKQEQGKDQMDNLNDLDNALGL
jgi:hypothetical protein